MKRAILVLLLVAFILPAYLFGQDYAVDKGVIMIGGEAYYMSAGGEDLYGDERRTEMLFNPGIAYFIMPGLALGVDFMYYSWSHGDNDNSQFGVGPSVAYYLGDADSKMYPYVGAMLMYTSDADDYTEMMYGGGAGVVFMVAKNVGISAQAFYLMQSYKPDGADDSLSGNIFGVMLGVDSFVF